MNVAYWANILSSLFALIHHRGSVFGMVVSCEIKFERIDQLLNQNITIMVRIIIFRTSFMFTTILTADVYSKTFLGR